MWGFAEPIASERHFLGVSRSATGRAWKSRLDSAAEGTAASILQRASCAEMLARVLAGRGVAAERVEGFLNPSLKQDLPDPSSLADMDRAAARLADAVQRRESVAVFGDYDVDGATSAALMHEVLAALGCPATITIPDRIFDGYGPNPELIDQLIAGGAKLIVCVDCGSTSFAALEHARARGAEVIVLDHHQVGTALPPAAALVNPNRQDDVSGLGYLAAVGVAFLAGVALLRELRRRNAIPAERMPDLLSYLDLVALGTICDLVPLTGVNRALVVKGLVAVRHTPRPGLRALTEVARLKGPPDCGDLGFLLGPRINAGGRIGDASLGARLLTTSDLTVAAEIAATLDRLNVERQGIESAAVAEAIAEADAEIGAGQGPAVLVASQEGWHPGVAGLIAARLKERFCRPAIAVAIDANGLGTGSGRSVPGVDLGAAIRAAVDAGILLKGGGHPMAAGLTVRREAIGELGVFLEARLGDEVRASQADRTVRIDGALSAGGATVELIAELERAGPFGTGNPSPVLAFPAHRIAFAEEKGNGHVRVELAADGGGKLKAIAFRSAATPLGRMLLASRGKPLHVAGTLCLDHWGGAARPQLRIIDAAAEPCAFR